MLIKSINNLRNVTKVTVQYVGNRERTFLLDQEALSEFDKSHHFNIGEFIAEKHGTDFLSDRRMKEINQPATLVLNGGNV